MEDKDWFFLVASCVFFFYVWGMWYHYKLQKYVEKRCKIPNRSVGSYKADRDADKVRKFFLRRARHVMGDADTQHHCMFRDEHAYRMLTYWDGWQYLRSFVWLCYELGIGAEFFTYNTKDVLHDERWDEPLDKRQKEYMKNNPEDFPHIDFKSPGSGFTTNLILFLASGGALLSIIAFIIYRVG